MNEIKVSDVMTQLVVTFRPQDSIHEAARRLLRNRISGAPVVEDGRLAGIVSEADLVAAFTSPARGETAFTAPDPLSFLLRGFVPRSGTGTTISDVMTAAVITVSPGDSVWEAASLIDRHGIRRLPVVDRDGYLVGIVARADLVRCMARSDGDISAAVREAVMVLGEENFIALDIDTTDGVVMILGTTDRKTTRDLATEIASRVPGVLKVISDLDWQWDDTEVKPVRSPSYQHEVGRWAVRPTMKEGVG